MPLGAVIGALGSHIIGGIGARRRERRQHQYNLQLADHQYDRQYQIWDEAWNRQTQYNDPQSQMNRLKKAGINPHMAYMQGGMSNTAETGSLPQYKQDGLQVAPSGAEIFSGLFQKYFQNQSMQIQLRKDKALADQEQIKASISASGLSQKKKSELARAGNELMKQEQQASIMYGDRGPGKLTGYQTGLQADTEMKELQLLVQKSQKTLNEITASNLITNDQLVEVQTDIARASFEFLKTEWFKELPPAVQAVFMALGKKLGGL